jgi:Fur family iron response transcriptional regulator
MHSFPGRSICLPIRSWASSTLNTLNLFLEKKLIREVIVDPSKVFYDPNTCEHHHYYDVVSGKLTDIHGDELAVTGLPKLPEGMVTDGIDIIVRIRPQNTVRSA